MQTTQHTSFATSTASLFDKLGAGVEWLLSIVDSASQVKREANRRLRGEGFGA